MSKITRGQFLKGAAALAGGALKASSLGVASATDGGTLDNAGPRPIGGRLGASRTGRAVEYSFDYPGTEDVFTVELQVWPDDGAVLQKAGFRVYSPDGSLHITGGAQRGVRPNVSANVKSRNRGRHVVQVYNYN